MRHLMFTVHDRKAGAFLRPFFMPTEPSAERAFSDLVNDSKHEFGKHPEDYTLFKCGSFDDVTGAVAPITPVAVNNGIVYLDVDRNSVDMFEDVVNG